MGAVFPVVNPGETATNQERDTPVPIKQEAGGCGGEQSQSGCFGEEINFLTLLGFKPYIIQPIAW
jgi:hypothetical protein